MNSALKIKEIAPASVNEPTRVQFIKQIAYMQKSIKAHKGQRNDFGGFDYRNSEDIMQAIKPHQGDLAIFISDEIQEVAGRVYVKATVTITDGVNEHSVSAFAREPAEKKKMDAMQVTGSASSYACKYALGKMFLLDNSNDADTWDNSKEGAKVQQQPRQQNRSQPQNWQQPEYSNNRNHQEQYLNQEQPHYQEEYHQPVRQPVVDRQNQAPEAQEIQRFVDRSMINKEKRQEKQRYIPVQGHPSEKDRDGTDTRKKETCARKACHTSPVKNDCRFTLAVRDR